MENQVIPKFLFPCALERALNMAPRCPPCGHVKNCKCGYTSDGKHEPDEKILVGQWEWIKPPYCPDIRYGVKMGAIVTEVDYYGHPFLSFGGRKIAPKIEDDTVYIPFWNTERMDSIERWLVESGKLKVVK